MIEYRLAADHPVHRRHARRVPPTDVLVEAGVELREHGGAAVREQVAVLAHGGGAVPAPHEEGALRVGLGGQLRPGGSLDLVLLDDLVQQVRLLRLRFISRANNQNLNLGIAK